MRADRDLNTVTEALEKLNDKVSANVLIIIIHFNKTKSKSVRMAATLRPPRRAPLRIQRSRSQPQMENTLPAGQQIRGRGISNSPSRGVSNKPNWKERLSALHRLGVQLSTAQTSNKLPTAEVSILGFVKLSTKEY